MVDQWNVRLFQEKYMFDSFTFQTPNSTMKQLLLREAREKKPIQRSEAKYSLASSELEFTLYKVVKRVITTAE